MLIPKDFKSNDLQVFILKAVMGSKFISVHLKELMAAERSFAGWSAFILKGLKGESRASEDGRTVT